MHAKPDLRVFLEWMIAGSGSVITDVMLSKLMIRNLTLLVSISLMGCNHQASEVQEFAAQQKPSSGTNSATTNEVVEGDGKPAPPPPFLPSFYAGKIISSWVFWLPSGT